MPSKTSSLKNATVLITYLLIVWGFYRFIFKLPEAVEDLVIKPIIWLLPVFYLLKREKKGVSSLGLTFKNLFPSIYMSLALGAFFAFIGGLVNYFKYGSLNFTGNIGESPFYTALFLSLVTGISEEIAFRGFIFNRIWHALGDEWKANYIVSIFYALVHLPIAILWWRLPLEGTLGVFILMICFSIGSSYIFARTKNVTSSILLHMLWEWPIILFR